ncbi:Phox-like protein [Linnemannia elongata AG-77]|uniref:Phox-like protein n=1 Tax=Linnemannia elongata AG-77 TaxID=1314771 RepID=A0A197JZC3_9FUNG|nr:Phox-like protein [Linnemannia elongata AG-77]
MAETLQAIYVRDYETRSQPKPHTVFKVEVHAAVRTWSVWKRYSEFETLNDRFLELFPDHPPPQPLPTKHWWQSTMDNPELLEERRAGLETYLRGILSHRDDRWRLTHEWNEFLAVPSWLEEFRNLQGISREVRSLINRRETHLGRNEISASHNCTIQSKKLLTSLGLRIPALENGLMSLAMGGGGGGGKGSIMSDGELRRRQDMLSELKDEREVLTKLVIANRQNDGMVGRVPNPRRVFGRVVQTLVQETSQTRGLDNEGLLLLQQEQMKQQDDHIEQFNAILQRQKHIGLAIGQELDNQIQLLDELDRDVDRTTLKLGLVNKKIGKIN